MKSFAVLLALAAASLSFPCFAELAPPKTRSEAIQRLMADPKLLPQNNGLSGLESYDPLFPPPPEAAGKTFSLSSAYPPVYDVNEEFPWMQVDFRKRPMEYLRVVLAYCVEGMDACDFAADKNQVREWYHAPWQQNDGKPKHLRRNGREYWHGLTKEKDADPGVLHPNQKDAFQNWAVGFYNARGGYTLGRVFNTPHGFPDPSQATFPAQTVSFKLLFTDATVEQVPFLKNSKEWTANIYKDARVKSPNDQTLLPRVDKTMRLLQIDVAIKDPRVAGFTGWVFGTFVYDAGAPGETVWDRMTPVGLSWGDDSDEPNGITQSGAFANERLEESRINATLLSREGEDPKERALLTHLGLGGRLNGPVDNPISSCISCHGRAGTWAKVWEKGGLDEDFGKPMPFITVDKAKSKAENFTTADFNQWFRPIGPGAHLEEEGGNLYITTDYSLQVSQGIRNFYQAVRANTAYVNALRGAVLAVPGLQMQPALASCSRDGLEAHPQAAPAVSSQKAEIKMLIADEKLKIAKKVLGIKEPGKADMRVCFFETPGRTLDQKKVIIRVRLEEKGNKRDVDATVKQRGTKAPPPGFESTAPEADWVGPDKTKDVKMSYENEEEDLDEETMRKVLSGEMAVTDILTDKQEEFANAALGQAVPWANLKRYGVIDAWKSKADLGTLKKVSVDYWRLPLQGKEPKELLEISIKTEGTEAEIAKEAKKFYDAAEAAGLGEPGGKSKTEEILKYYAPGQ